MYRHRPTHFEKKRSPAGNPWEMLEFKRLLWALVLFFTVFLGKQIYPERVLSVGQEVVAVLGTSTDLEAVFAQLGESMSQSGSTLNGLGEFCVEVFGSRNEDIPRQTAVMAPQLPVSGAGLLNRETTRTVLYSQLLPEPENTPETEAMAQPATPPAVPAVGTILTIGKNPTTDLPDGYTVNELSFGSLDTVVPVMGQLTSGFGYRDHPVNGKYLFHGGVDIAANAGDPIAAFADGQVEYVGEDRSYGLYFQIDHGNGVKSFYAHCQSICVRKGQTVQAGEKVATVGSTGTATGPHLHLELKCGDLRVDPAYYLEFLSVT